MNAPRWHYTRCAAAEAKIFEIINAAAEARTFCPSNQEMMRCTGHSNSSTISNIMRRLEDKGLLRVEGARHYRRVHIIATGKSTQKRSECVVPPIIQGAAFIWGVRASDIYGPARFQRFTRPRMAACMVSTEVGLGFAEIGEFLGSDHTTIIHARKTAAVLEARDPDYREKLAMLRAHARLLPMQVAA